MKIILTKENYYSHIGTDPVPNSIIFNDEWNLDNLPTQAHKWNGETFILDEAKVVSERKQKEEELASLKLKVEELELWLKSN